MRFYGFGRFRLDTLNHVLVRGGEAVPLKPKVFDTLLVLVENHGRVLDKDELMARLWPDTTVEESNLTQNIYVLRRTLSQGPEDTSYIETVPRRGYRFVAPVSAFDVEHGPLLLARDTEVSADTRPDGRRVGWQAAAVAIGATVLIGVGAYSWTIHERSARSGAAVKSVAVLPFKALDPNTADDLLGFGMADTLITRLSAIRELVVRPTGAVRRFAPPGQDALAAGRELKVDAVLEASVQRTGDRVRVTLRLLRVADGSAIWAGQVDQDARDPLALEDHVASEVSRRLVPIMTDAERNRLTRHETDNPDAHRLYVLGRFHSSRVNAMDWQTAIEYFNGAIADDPNYAVAYAGLADCYLSVVADSRLSKAQAIPKAREAATKALALADAAPEPHVAIARIMAYYDWDWDGAEREFTRALDLNPNSCRRAQGILGIPDGNRPQRPGRAGGAAREGSRPPFTGRAFSARVGADRSTRLRRGGERVGARP